MVKCPECIKEGIKSTVSENGGAALAVYVPIMYDEDGNLVPNSRKTSWINYRCSNGHEWSE